MRPERGTILMGLGFLCLASAIVLILKNNREERRGEAASAAVIQILERDVIPKEGIRIGGQRVEEECIQTVEVDGNEYIGVLKLPSLGLTLPVMNRWSDELLKLAPCRYKGSYLENSMIIAGHNYKKHFSGIKQMEKGDSVIFTDVDGNQYSYEVDSLETIKGADQAGMDAGDWDLTLFTCNYGGRKRIAVRCRLTAH